jgi:hypothetical protein
MDDKNAGWVSSRERFTVWAAVIMALGAFSAIVVACFIKDVTVAEKIVALLISFVGTPLGYLFGYSTTKSAEVSANEKVAGLGGQISQLSEAIAAFKSENQINQGTIEELTRSMEKLKLRSREK